jgi:hypothetical protein
MPKSDKKDTLENSKSKSLMAETETDDQIPPDNSSPFWKIFLPAIIVGALILIYAVFNIFFIQCRLNLCSPIDGTLISVIDKDKALNLSEASTNINSKVAALNATETTLSNRRTLQKTVEDNLALTKSRLDAENIRLAKLTGETDPAPDEDENNEAVPQTNLANSPDANVAALKANIKTLKQTEKEQKAELTKRESAMNKALKDRDEAVQEVVGARKNLSTRYTSRALWAFFTGLYLVLFIAAVWFTVSTMNQALEGLSDKTFWGRRRTWHGLTFLTAVVFLIVIFSGESSFASIVGPMYKLSILATNEIPAELIFLFNALALASTVYLVAASCSMLYAVWKGKDLKFWRDNSRILLYLGGALLFVGLLRIDIISKWHLVFVGSVYQSLLQSYFTTSLTIQALFYTIILAAIYLPLSYEFPSTTDDPSVAKSMSDDGFWSTITTFAPRLILLISPLLAQPIADLFKFLLNVQAE